MKTFTQFFEEQEQEQDQDPIGNLADRLKLQPQSQPQEIDLPELQRALAEAIFGVLKQNTHIEPQDCSIFARKYGTQIGTSITQFLSQ